jgi:N6-adenosine-specific RNA methylase IME4
MKVSGVVEAVERDERGIKIKLNMHDRQFWVPEVIRSKAKDLKVGDTVTVTANPGRFYEFVESIERGEASAPNALPLVSGPATKTGPEPPKTEITVSEPQLPDSIVVEDEELASLANRIVKIRDSYELSITKDILSLHWEIGQEIWQTRLPKDSYRELARATGINRENLRESVAFYEKYPKRDFEIKAWRRHVAELPEIKETVPMLPEDKFTVIYADPPWQYEFSAADRLAPETHYSTLSAEQICDLKIPTEDDAVLFLWSPAPKIEEALEAMEKWGFKYRTNFVWTKDQFGMGYWTRAQHELLLLGVKGKVAPPEEADRFPSVVPAPRTEHSAKPPVFYEMIEKMFPSQKKIELFARGPERKGWVFWGIEVER